MLSDLKEECQSKEAHEGLQEETVLVIWAGADLKDRKTSAAQSVTWIWTARASLGVT